MAGVDNNPGGFFLIACCKLVWRCKHQPAFCGADWRYAALCQQVDFNNLFVPIGKHAIYDTAFFLLTGEYLVAEKMTDNLLNIRFGSLLVLLAAAILFTTIGRGLLIQETTGWE